VPPDNGPEAAMLAELAAVDMAGRSRALSVCATRCTMAQHSATNPQAGQRSSMLHKKTTPTQVLPVNFQL
jgi:hypothetical protein